MTKRAARNIGLLFAAALAVPLITTTSAAASADTGGQTGIAGLCHAWECEGHWPDKMLCDQDAKTVKTASVQGISIHLRYSPSCRAAWGRISGGVPGDRVHVHSSDGSHFGRENGPGVTGTWTKMVDDANKVAWACAHDLGTGQEACTGKY
ncbi:DUF2690 domain-containing protein [Amycolatopsis magusensis]|uniref:DUF2690 domain-containing protein n=1 Tax=Amycolatopsis magusensis TaxID=882444 RepID=UPI0024A7EE7C|nr:DUF2690 domain-containing protein [Amycolatopsis magusensis]MDI5980005.1 DUF2690 domain-containing protein [Amycolatopsis magusensis]